MERISQGRFVPDANTNEFVIAKPLPTDCYIRMYGDAEVYVLTQEASLQLIAQATDSIRKSQDEFYAANPHLRGDRAYYSWLAQASDQ